MKGSRGVVGQGDDGDSAMDALVSEPIRQLPVELCSGGDDRR